MVAAKIDYYVIDDLVNKARIYMNNAKEYFKTNNTTLPIDKEFIEMSDKCGVSMPLTKKLFESLKNK